MAPILARIVAALVMCSLPTGADALTTTRCLAGKAHAAGRFLHCQASAKAAVLLGGPSNSSQCTTKFRERLMRLTERADNTGIPCRYEDRGDGTILDYDTGLQWEKKTSAVGSGPNPADLHDVDNTYVWAEWPYAFPNGSAFYTFLFRLNLSLNHAIGTPSTAGFAGHSDWRLPSIEELETIVDLDAPGCGSGAPCIDPIFGPTSASLHYSSTGVAENADFVWQLRFSDGGSFFDLKTYSYPVRAVRAGWSAVSLP
jgi:hypothetical protein